MQNKRYFKIHELILWISSLIVVTVAFFFGEKKNYLSLVASLVGVTALLFNAKGNPAGPALMIVFGVCYGIISWGFRYYGEMLTYLGMSVPMDVLSLVSWLKNPFEGRKSQVKINELSAKEYPFALFLTAVVTVIFYFVLKAFDTANLWWSTVSVATSFLAVYFSFRRSPLFAFAYALNDLVLIVLWVLASVKNSAYISVVACFFVFFVNDLYTFVSWKKLKKMQKISTETEDNPAD